MRIIQLANIIIDRCGALREEAFCLAWRILNEYPDDFRTAAIDLAEGHVPTINVDGTDLEAVKKASGTSDFYALELLRIISCNAEAGKNLVFTLGLRI